MDGLNFISRGNHCVIQSNVKLIKILYINVLNDISVKPRCLSRHGLTEARSLCCCHITPWKHQGGISGLACCVYSTSTTNLATWILHTPSLQCEHFYAPVSLIFWSVPQNFGLPPTRWRNYIAELCISDFYFFCIRSRILCRYFNFLLLMLFMLYDTILNSIFTDKTDKTDQYMHYNVVHISYSA